MNTRQTIRKILFVAMWLVIGSGMLVLLIAAMGKQKKNSCKDYTISIRGAKEENCFLSKADIARLLKAAAGGDIRGQAKSSFNLQQMENLLEENAWVKDAQLYFDNKDVLHVTVSEREPVARIFTSSGKSFYIDEEDNGIPLSENLSVEVPVFTGVPDKKDRIKKDSLLLQDIRTTAQFINSDSFWRSQVAQIDLVKSAADGTWEFEMIPVIGNHVVKLGNGESIKQKFNRLFIFYKEILSRTGFDKYKTVDVRFAGQVVGGKSENPRVDSVQLRKNVENLLKQIDKITDEAEAITKTMEKSVTASSGNKETGNVPVSHTENLKLTEINHDNPASTTTGPPARVVEQVGTPKAVMKKVRRE